MSGFKKKIILLCANSILVVGLISCASDDVPKPKPIPKIENIEKISTIWDVDALSSSNAASFIPIIDDNAIFTADSAGDIFRIDETDGTIISRFKLKRKLSSGTATSSDSIFVTSMDGYLLSLDKVSGKIKWQVQLPTIAVEAPQVAGDIIVLRTNDSQLSAYNVNSGSLLWAYQRQNPPLTLRAYNTFQIVGKDVVLLGQPGGRMALLNLNNGTPIWENYVAIPEGATDLDKLTDVAMRPVVNDKEICVATYNGKIACLDAISSSIIWSKTFSSNYGVLVDEQNVYGISVDGVVYAFDKNTGATIWHNDILQYRYLSVPVFLGNNLLIVDSDGYINLLNRNDGKLLARVISNLKDGVSYPWSDGTKVFLQSGNGNLEKITQ